MNLVKLISDRNYRGRINKIPDAALKSRVRSLFYFIFLERKMRGNFKIKAKRFDD